MKSTRKIGWILGLVFLLPALFFSVYEISSLNRDEELIQQVYARQLEAMLFSVNQYSDDVMNSWITKIQNGLEETVPADSMPSRIRDLLTFNTSIRYIFTIDSGHSPTATRIFSSDEVPHTLEGHIDSALFKNIQKINQLVSYRRSGFQKIDILPYEWRVNPPVQCLFFIHQKSEQPSQLVGLLVGPEEFVVDIVGPRLQVIARDQFVLSVFDKAAATAIYSTLRYDSSGIAAEAQTKDLWLFPNHTLGIRTKEASLQSLVDKRTTTNLYLLISLNIILILAVVLVFRNVKREVQLAQNKADFVSNVSHEIRTPLALISMFAETLEMGRVPSEEKKKEYYAIISQETQRLTSIVNRILNFSQTEANKKKLNVTVLHVHEALQTILKTYDFHLRQKGFEYSVVSNTNVTVFADHEAFSEVVINLMDNAIKYSPDHKHIEISTGIENNMGFISVKDHGLGITKADQKHIFDKFYRVSSGNLAKSQGTGLGLSLVKQLMEAQGGKVSVKSELGEGSVFTLHFQLDQTKA